MSIQSNLIEYIKLLLADNGYISYAPTAPSSFHVSYNVAPEVASTLALILRSQGFTIANNFSEKNVSTDAAIQKQLTDLVVRVVDSVDISTELYVIGGTRFQVSSDGINWTLANNCPLDSCNEICWNGTVFAAVGSGATYACFSTNGKDWTAASVDPFASCTVNTICWSDTLQLFVAGASGGSTVMATSPDGDTWTARAVNFFNQCYCVCWSPDLAIFVAVGSSSSALLTIITSSDGVTWNPAPSDPFTETSFASGTGYSVCWGGNQFVALGITENGTPRSAVSSNGTSWTITGTPANVFGICYNGSGYLSVGETPSYNVSLNGTVWNDITSPAWFGTADRIIWTGTQFVMPLYGASIGAAVSINGIDWTESNADTSYVPYCVAYSPGSL